MKLIQWECKAQKEWWQTYVWQQDKWQQEKRFYLSGQEQVYQLLKHQSEPYTWAIIGLNMAYRNTFYTLMPQIQVIIPPEILFQYIAHFCKVPIGYHEEVAISVDAPLIEEWEEVQAFLKTFYGCPSLEEAQATYEKWQLERSLGNLVADKLQMVIELFNEEIFRYFRDRSFLPLKINK